MRRTWGLVVLCLTLLANTNRADDAGTVIELDGLKSRTPGNWVSEKATNQMRIHQFRVPKATGDKDDAEIVIFYFGTGGGGSVADNMKRWKGMFVPPDGKTIDDVAKVSESKVGEVKLTTLDVQGTYLFKAAPFDPNARTEKKEAYRMLGVVFESPKGPYFVRLVGPAKTVEANKKGFDNWLMNFK